MGAKSQQTSTINASPAVAAPDAAASATPDQSTLGNAAISERIAKAPKAAEPSMLFDAEGDWDIIGFAREMQITGFSTEFFPTAYQFEQTRMLLAASQSQAADLLATISTHEAKRLFGRVPAEERLKLALARPSIVGALDDELIVEFMFSKGADALVNHLTVRQVTILTNAESGGHPQLARLLRRDSVGILLDEAFLTMPTYEEVEFLLALDRVSPDAARLAIGAWGWEDVGEHLDAAMRDVPEQFDALEALFVRDGYGSEVELWYQAHEGK